MCVFRTIRTTTTRRALGCTIFSSCCISFAIANVIDKATTRLGVSQRWPSIHYIYFATATLSRKWRSTIVVVILVVRLVHRTLLLVKLYRGTNSPSGRSDRPLWGAGRIQTQDSSNLLFSNRHMGISTRTGGVEACAANDYCADCCLSVCLSLIIQRSDENDSSPSSHCTSRYIT